MLRKGVSLWVDLLANRGLRGDLVWECSAVGEEDLPPLSFDGCQRSQSDTPTMGCAVGNVGDDATKGEGLFGIVQHPLALLVDEQKDAQTKHESSRHEGEPYSGLMTKQGETTSHQKDGAEKQQEGLVGEYPRKRKIPHSDADTEGYKQAE